MKKTSRSLTRLAMTVMALFGLTACYEHTYTIGTGAEYAPVVHESWRHHWIAGLISPDQELELREICPSGNATIHEEQTFLNGLVGMLTSGIYYPSTVTVRCRGGRNRDLQFSAEDAQRIAGDPGFLDLIEELAPERYQQVVEALTR